MNEEKRYQVALSLIRQIGPVLSKQLINHFGSPKEVIRANSGKIKKVNGIGEKLAALLPKESDLLRQTDALLEKSERAGINIHYYKEESYPKRLFQLNDAPIVLYSRGNVSMNPSKSLGIVGTRKATQYGLEIANSIVQDAKSYSPTIISGLAFGIDIKAHRCSLKESLPTIGVLACGLDKVYPSSHRATAEKMLEKGGLVSEYPVGTVADPRFFPARNRIIAGLSDGLIVVEAAKKGGALISAEIMSSYDKPLFAVPGNLKATYSEGCNYLIRSMKAAIYTHFNDVVESLNWDGQLKKAQQEVLFSDLTNEEKKVVSVLHKNGQRLHLDQLSWQSQIPLSQLAGILLQLEFAGVVRPMPGKEYRLV